MKKIFKCLALGFMAVGLFSACSEETFDTVNQAGVPQADQIDAVITVDQTTNQVSMKLNNPGCYPVWRVYTKAKPVISTSQVYNDIVTVAGTYQVEVKMGNRNGICDGSKVYEFTVENTLIDFGPYMQRLTGGESKEWKFAQDVVGHLGCGPSGSEGLEWWSAQPNDKAGVGLYENRFTFTNTGGSDTGGYTYDPGTSGTVYVNTGVTDLAPYSASNPNDGNDYAAPATLQETTFSIKAEGNSLYLELPEGTLMGYIPFNEAVSEPKYRIIDLKADRMDLVVDNGGIAWHYTLGTLGEPAFTGFKFDSEYNLWRNANITLTEYWYAPNWEQIADPEAEMTEDGFTVTLPSATTDQWQAQMKLTTDLSTNSSTNYDFSVILTSNADHPGVTVKLTDSTNDGVFYFAERLKLKANEDYVFYLSDMPGLDIATLQFVFDFGGNSENQKITVSNIVLKDHANDDGTVLPKPEDVPDPTWNTESELNLWNSATWKNSFYYAPGWNQIDDPEIEVEGCHVKVNLPEATFEKWQAQVVFLTDMTTQAGKFYDFRVVVTPNQKCPVTVKLVRTGDDGVFYIEETRQIEAYEDGVFKFINAEGIDMTEVSLVFDFGGCPAGTVVEINDICLQEHQD